MNKTLLFSRCVNEKSSKFDKIQKKIRNKKFHLFNELESKKKTIKVNLNQIKKKELRGLNSIITPNLKLYSTSISFY